MQFHYGKFVWFEHLSQDMTQAHRFYEALFNWHASEESIGGQHYTMLLNHLGGIGGLKRVAEGTPAH